MPWKNGYDNGRKLTTPQSVNAAIKAICDIMRRSNCAGALQYVSELTWVLFLRILDEREVREAEEAEAVGAEFTPFGETVYDPGCGTGGFLAQSLVCLRAIGRGA